MIPNAAKGMRNGLERVVREAKQVCPVDTGELLNSIRAEVNEYATFVTGTVGTNKEYAVYVEMGTGDKGRESGGNGSPVQASYRTKWGGMRARPYLWPAWKANREKVLASIRRAVLKGVRGGG